MERKTEPQGAEIAKNGKELITNIANSANYTNKSKGTTPRMSFLHAPPANGSETLLPPGIHLQL
jgi:hypothetical protein